MRKGVKAGRFAQPIWRMDKENLLHTEKRYAPSRMSKKPGTIQSSMMQGQSRKDGSIGYILLGQVESDVI